MFDVAPFLRCVMSDVNSVAAVQLKEVAVSLNVTAAPDVIEIRAVVLRDLQSVFAVGIEGVGVRDRPIAKHGRHPLSQMHTALRVAVEFVGQTRDINVHSADPAQIDVRLVLNGNDPDTVLKIVVELTTGEDEVREGRTVIAEAGQAVAVQGGIGHGQVDDERIEEVKRIDTEPVADVVVNVSVGHCEVDIDLLEPMKSHATRGVCRTGDAVIRVKAIRGRSMPVACDRVAVKFDRDAGIGLNINSQPVLTVAVDDVFVDEEIETVFHCILGENVKPVLDIIRHAVLLDDDRVQIRIFRSDEVETVQLVIQECIVCQLQILDSRPLLNGEQKTVSIVALVVDSDRVSIDHRL